MTELEAANKALALLGVAPIESLDRDIQAARTINMIFGTTKMAVLAEFAWSFALRLEPLEALPDIPPPPGWSHNFAYPADAAALYQVYGDRPGGMTKINYIVQNGVISANEARCNAEYTVMPDFEDWPALAAEAFVVRLASDAAPTLAGSPQLSMSLLEKYQLMATLARTNSLNEEFVPAPKSTHYLDVRG
jgi:hypothetical protein